MKNNQKEDPAGYPLSILFDWCHFRPLLILARHSLEKSALENEKFSQHRSLNPSKAMYNRAESEVMLVLCQISNVMNKIIVGVLPTLPRDLVDFRARRLKGTVTRYLNLFFVRITKLVFIVKALIAFRFFVNHLCVKIYFRCLCHLQKKYWFRIFKTFPKPSCSSV